MTETEIEPSREDLKKKSISGAAINMVSQMVKFALLFINQVVMARLLVPQDFGLVAMVAPVMAFVVMFADLGLSQATIQRAKISQQELSFLFWVNVAVATTLAFVVMAISPLVAMFYHEPRVMMITAVMGGTLILSGLCAQQTAIFNRNMEFRKMAIIDISTLIVGFTAGVVAALAGMEYWSLVVIHASIYTTNVIMSWTLSKWRPSRPSVPDDWKSLLRFGGNLSGFYFVNYFARNLDNILIGKYKGEVALGLYDRAYKLLLMPLSQITTPLARVALPLMSRTLNEPVTYRRAYMRMLEIIMLITYPGVLYAVIDHDNLIRTVLGDQWAGVGPIFAVLGAGSFLQTITHTTGWLFISQDRTREMRNWGVFSSSVIIASFIVGLPWGPLGVATAYLAVTTFQGPVVCWAATRKGPVQFRHLLQMVYPHVIALAFAGLAVYGASLILPKGLLAIFALLPLAYIVFGAVFYAIPSGRAVIHETFKHTHATLIPYFAKYFRKDPKPQEEI